MRNDITRRRTGAFWPLSARGVFPRVVAILALTLGLLGMHTLGGGGHEVASAAMQGVTAHDGGHAAMGHDGGRAVTAHAAASHAAGGASLAGNARLMAHDKRLRDAGPAATCVPSHPEGHSGAHCIPAPGPLAPVPPDVVVLDRSDALPQPPAAAAPRSVLARAPAPDLVGLSISRT